jgi:hypothetical protein
MDTTFHDRRNHKKFLLAQRFDRKAQRTDFRAGHHRGIRGDVRSAKIVVPRRIRM